MARLLLFVVFALVAAACGTDETGPRAVRQPDTGETGDDAGADPDGAETPDDVAGADAGADASGPDAPGPGADGAALYAAHCARCHGDDGSGGIGPAIDAWTADRAALVERIATTMPPGQADDCTGTCAEKVADHVLAFSEAAPVDCDAPAYGPRQLRLLNRREYANTVVDLLGLSVACATDDACPDEAPICDGGRCAPRPCGRVVFEFDPRDADYTTVHVAGTFNSWAGTVDAGGWPMRRDPDGLWRLETTLEPGAHGYKYVLDERDWIVDPDAERFEDDGFGGSNALIDVDCDAGTSPLTALTASFPPEIRPAGFGFDTNAAAARVTPVHVTEYAAAAAEIAELVVADPAAYLGCDDRATCRTAVLEDFAFRAFRRPLTAGESERYGAAMDARDTLDDALRVGLRTVLASPHFLYRSELGVEQADGSFALTPYEVATALSYTFWGTMPDAALFAAAGAGELDETDEIVAQARRLLADPRARDMVGVFGVQWLGVESILTSDKNPELFPEVDDTLRAAMLDETRRFVTHVVFDGSGVFDELLDADYTFANARLAAIYGLDADGADLGRVSYSLGIRAGVLGHASVLGTYAHSDQTSPIRRGLFVRQHLLCQDFPEPPPNAGGVPEIDPDATTRERFAQHTADPFCASCHQYIDDLGFGFESFDPIGRFRTEDGGHPVDAAGNMNDVNGLGTGTDAPFEGLVELADVLVESDAAAECFVRQFHRFAFGASEDECGVRSVHAAFGAAGFDVIEMMVATVADPSFRRRR